MSGPGQASRWEATLKFAIREATVGLFVAVCVSILIYATPLAEFGSDLSQRLFLFAGQDGGALGVSAKQTSPDAKAWVFVDLGGKFCGESGGELCQPNKVHTDRRALATLLATIRAQHPRVVVLDVFTAPASAAEDADLIRVFNTAGPPILLSWAPDASDISDRPDGSSTLVVRPSRLLCDPFHCPFRFARYFPALRRVSGPTSRSLAPEFTVADIDDGRITAMPAIAYAAALTAETGGADPWAWTARFGHDEAQGDLLAAFRETDRVFSFAPVVAGTPQSFSVVGGGVNFIHYAPEPDPSAATVPDLRDAVVVIGDSRTTAGDRSWSAAGSVSGAELILNDARQLLVAPPRPEPGLPGHVLAEWPFLLAGFLALLLVQFALGLRPEKAHRARSPLRAAALETGRELATLLLVSAAAALLFALAMQLPVYRFGAVADVVTPFIAILLETFIEVMHRFMSFVQTSTDIALEYAAAKLKRVAP